MDNSYKVLGPRIQAAQPKMVCRKEGGDGDVEKANTWQPLCGWCHVALPGLFGLERLIKYFPLLQCIDLVSMRKISGNGEGRDAWFYVRLRCVCSDSGRHRGQRRQGQSQRVLRGDTAES